MNLTNLGIITPNVARSNRTTTMIIANCVHTTKHMNERWNSQQNMPEEEPLRWKKDNELAAQLFRDFYFGRYDANTQVTDIFSDPSREYSKLSKGSFYKHVKSTRERVNTFKSFGTGLDEKFRDLVKLNSPPSDAQSTGSDADSDFDLLDDSGDISLDGVDLDSAFDELRLNKEIADVSIPKKRKLSTAKVEHIPEMVKLTIDAATSTHDSKYMVPMADGRIVCVMRLPSGFQGNFSVSDDGKQVLMEMDVPDLFYNAKRIFDHVGDLGSQNIAVLTLQAAMNKQRASDIKAMGEKEGYGGTVKKSLVVFQLPFEVRQTFFEVDGAETNQISVCGDDNGPEWAYFFLLGVHATLKPSKTGNIVRRSKQNTRKDSTDVSNKSRKIGDVDAMVEDSDLWLRAAYPSIADLVEKIENMINSDIV